MSMIMPSPDGILDQAVSIVTQKILSLDNMAVRYSSQLSSALADIAGVQVPSVPAPSRLSPPDAIPPSVPLGAMPTFSAPPMNIPEIPGELNIDYLLADLDIGEMDAIPAAPAMIAVNIPEAPGMASIAVPERPSVNTEIVIPDAPAIEMPSMEVLEQINLPAFSFPELPSFDATPPSTAGITVPNVFINWVEPEYRSEVLDDLVARVRSMMAGGTGLPAPIEDALFSRARERQGAETTRAVQEATDTWARVLNAAGHAGQAGGRGARRGPAAGGRAEPRHPD